MESKPLDPGLLRSFSPLDGLKSENLYSLSRKTSLRELSEGRLLFKEGDVDKHTFYLVSGIIELVHDGRSIMRVRGGSPDARNALAPASPRRYSARVVSDHIEFVSIDSNMLDVMLTWDQTGTYEVSELLSTDQQSSSDDWMTTLLQTPAFHRIPAANIQAIFMRMQRVDFKAGELIIKQGDEGDYFYAIVKGECQVLRETPINKDGIKLAQLTTGDTFGEEALISDARRNANVQATTDVTLMRLGKQDFQTLLNEPTLRWVEFDTARKLVANEARWLDVRLPSEFDHGHLDDAINLPLYFLRLKMKSLDRNVHYIVCCDTGRRSSAGAYLLTAKGFKASVLRDGIPSSAFPMQ